MAYTKTVWVDNSAPAIDATNLNNIETGIENQYKWVTKTDADNYNNLTKDERKVFVDTTGAATFLVLPDTPVMGDEVKFVDVAGNFATNKLTVIPDGLDKIMGVNENFELTQNYDFVTFTYSGATYGWVITDKP